MEKGRNKRILVLFGVVLILAFAYFFVTPFLNETNTENSQLNVSFINTDKTYFLKEGEYWIVESGNTYNKDESNFDLDIKVTDDSICVHALITERIIPKVLVTHNILGHEYVALKKFLVKDEKSYRFFIASDISDSLFLIKD